MHYITNVFAQTYGAGVYGSCSTYSSGPPASTSTCVGTGGTAGTTGGVLTNTGFDLVLAATVACAIVFAALVIRFWKKPKVTARAAAGD